MSVVAPRQGLSKPKSKLRLRLGLTPPHPKESKLLRTKSSDRDLNPSKSTKFPDSDLMSSITSSMTGVTLSSRADSRDAFVYDNRDDTVSYATTSPESNLDISLNNYTREKSLDLQSYRGRHDYREVDYRNDDNRKEDENDDEDPLDSSMISPSILITHPADEDDEPEDDHLSHPNIQRETAASDDIFSLSDRQLHDRFSFIEEIGYGNWGSVWSVKPRHIRSSIYGFGKKSNIVVRLGRSSVANGGSGAGGKVAVKLVHRGKTSVTAARVKALWGEMKIIKSLKHEPHPSIIQFEAFVITPTYALVIMPFLPELIPVQLPIERAKPYFRQLASAIGYLHERGITHNDIKPANVLLSHNDVPVLVDFGFANKWEFGGRGAFLSCISWGTPEYLDPQRAMGQPHDERASDVWSLGITMYEILIGRTPFEEDQEEAFNTPEELLVYFDRSKQGVWLGDWSMPDDMIHLLRMMIQPDPAYRITAMQAYHHPALQPPTPTVIITPHFVRAAATFEPEEDVPLPAPVPAPNESNITTRRKPVDQIAVSRRHKKDDKENVPQQKATTRAAEKGKEVRKDNAEERKYRKKVEKHRSATPTFALGESIKQHTVSQDETEKESSGIKRVKQKDDKSRLVIRKSRDDLVKRNSVEDEQDPTPTKVLKPAQPLRIKELADKKVWAPRTSNSELATLSRPTSTTTVVPTHKVDPLNRESAISVLSNTSSAPQTKEEAVQKAMRNLEGSKRRHEVLAAIKRPAPPAPTSAADDDSVRCVEGSRPCSLDSSLHKEGRKWDERRSLGDMRLGEVAETEEKMLLKVEVSTPSDEGCMTLEERRKTVIETVIPSPTVHVDVNLEVEDTTNVAFPQQGPSPLAELRDKIINSDRENLSRFRKISGDLLPPSADALPQRQSIDAGRAYSEQASAMDDRLDKISAWVKSVERIVEEARQALAECRDPPLPPLSFPADLLPQTLDSLSNPETQKQFGVTPAKQSMPAHLRTSSTQVEPATPPKWFSCAEAVERITKAQEGLEEVHAKKLVKEKKERPSVAHVLKLFGAGEKGVSRTNTPEPTHTVPLALPQTQTLRGMPSTPALRTNHSQSTRRVPARKSESNLRFNTLPTIPSPVALDDFTQAQSQALNPPTKGWYTLYPDPYSGDGPDDNAEGSGLNGESWTSRLAPPSVVGGERKMGKSTSIASLREKAKAWIRDDQHNKSGRNIIDLSQAVQEEPKRSSRLVSTFSVSTTGRPGTPAVSLGQGVGQVVNAGAKDAGGKVRGFFRGFRNVVAGK